jgi:hypothetical protein
VTDAEARLWRRIQRRAADLQPELAAALLRGVQLLRAEMTGPEFLALLEGGDPLAVLAWLDDLRLERAFGPLRQALQLAYVESARASVRDVGRTIRRSSVALDVFDPNTVRAIERLETKVIGDLTTGLRETVRATVRESAIRGLNPRETARDLRGAIGLGPTQQQQVRNFRAALETGDVAKALGYQRRDRRFDRTIRRGNLTPAEIDRMVDAYERRRLALNAETVARTAALDTQRAAQNEAWGAAIRSGAVDAGDLRRRWVTILDGRERPAHHAMHGTVVRWGEPFLVPGVGPQMTPGESEYNCFPGGTLVSGSFVAGMRAAYSGPAVEVHTAQGHVLTVTPNHPILTTRGWVPASHVQQGDHVIAQRVAIPPSVADCSDEQQPSTIAQVFEALRAKGSERSSVAGFHFNGDAEFLMSDVDVVGANGELRHESVVDSQQEVDHRSFCLTQTAQPSLHGSSAPDANVEAVPLASPGRMGGGHLPRTFFDAHGRPFEPLSIGAAAHWLTQLGESSKQDLSAVPAFVSELLHAASGAVLPDEVVKVRHLDSIADRHVYDLQAEDGWIVANGIVCSNCRCVAWVFTEGTPVGSAPSL